MTIALRYAARSDVGLVRSVNQDSGYAGPHLLVLADGMGGPAGGDIASSVAIAHLAGLDGESHGADDLLDHLDRAVQDAHEELRDLAAEDPELAGLGTTLIAMLRSGNKLAMVHVGDSRAYVFRDARLERITSDHTFVQHLVDIGRLTEEEAEHHPQRSVLLRVLGDSGPDVVLDESVREARVGDRYLLCSDGLSSYVSADTITTTVGEVRDPAACAEALIELALRAGAPDNVTCVVADVVDVDALPDGAAPDPTPQVVGAAATDRHRPTRGGSGAAARAAALNPAADVEPDEDPKPARRRWVRPVLVVALVLAILAGAGYGFSRWTQTQYYVAASGDYVAIYQGIPQEIGPVRLSHVVVTTDLRVEDLPPFAQDRLTETIVTGSFESARGIVRGLEEQSTAPEDPTASPTPTPSPSPTAPGQGGTPAPSLPPASPAPTEPPDDTTGAPAGPTGDVPAVVGSA
ncbi:protein serine/threonine phosphatase [Beutenbergia cavernae DSM 12333]|uniref:Protein serine/threonine phosphatase n=1 Tax=Beutenbergia cavernae (strain ATCC BAA-8 / DSM 12333 / CCUG 43141 / JCM 11478 / NBRC 16432 / NCIMB 13614 / HKI 0122) TaxID=471853 RepID=C5BUS2_BEUC1|nr:PP2C family serine/threonine-protein phosphatase [Beutenbergia cavernae]ACQ78296.1 protein serine/threonine phosphatase [Beutenbergia cavernae DSM 12333]